MTGAGREQSRARGIDVPAGLDAQRRLGQGWADWLDRLPRLAAEVVAEWGLEVEGPSTYGFCSLVLPVRTTEDLPTVLKLHTDADAEESDHEYLALRRWDGHGAVRLLRADPRRRAMLLERLHTTDLTAVDDVQACEVVATLYPRLHLPALPQLRTQTSYVAEWTERLARLPRDAPLPRRLVEQAVSRARDLVADPASAGTIIHGDLHYGNVLAADREPWLAIDPKPTSGDPHYEVAPMLWNRWDELSDPGGQSVRDGVRRRFHTLVDAAGLDEDRARDWVVVRMLHNALWELEDHGAAADRDWLTTCVAVAKAVGD